MLKVVNLSFSSFCGADCLFCPNGSSRMGAGRNMSLALCVKMADELASPEFKAKHSVHRIEIGENGDAFLNPDCLEMLRSIRKRLPDMHVSCYTNFQTFGPDKSRAVLSEGLVQEFYCNIDGATQPTYGAVKNLDIKKVSENINSFLTLRRELANRSPLHVQVLPYSGYIGAVNHYLGRNPLKLKSNRLLDSGSGDDYNEVKRYWEGSLETGLDTISKITGIFLWAERGQVDVSKLDYACYSCPNIRSVKEQAYVSPEGNWYACCYDSGGELVLGSVVSASLDEIYKCEKRRDFISALENRSFASIGGPCRTINCCSKVYFDSDDLVMRLKIAAHSLMNKFKRLI